MGEAILEAFLPALLEELTDRDVIEYLGRLKGVDKKVLEKWARTLTAIEAVLSDAEERQLTHTGVKQWLDDLRDLAYDIEDILDTFATKVLKRRIERQGGSRRKLWISQFSKPKFNFSLNSAIKNVTERLEEITTRQKQFGFEKLGVSRKPWKMPPTTSQLDGPVIGRDEAKAKILHDLLSEGEHSTSNFRNFHVVSIVGTGGLGKTTLAKHVFNDAATEQFSPKGWVSVSDDFDLLRVTTAILESVTSGDVKESKELNSVQEKLSKELAGKKFLIVLDDVWNTCNYDQWTTLQSAFRVGAVGSIILVTTRDANVAKMMGDTKPHNLESMSEVDCWEVFVRHALLNNIPQDVVLLKEKILVKCNGLPLAARTLGGLLRCKRVDEWEELLDHKLWNLSDQMGILPALQLSYHYLPSKLKRCFTYCAILPNNYVFGEMQLILLWMAEGLIPQQGEENKRMEDLGSEYFQELVSRSLFQKSSKGNSRYMMHDLVIDLARWAARSSCSRLEDMQNYDSQLLPKVRHSSYILDWCDGVKKFEVYSEATCLRTFLPLSFSDFHRHHLAPKVISDLLPKLQYLRLLSLNGYEITELPNTIGELKHLRYLDLSYTQIRSLPDSATTLYNLQTLILHRCDQLESLPAGMRNLVNLRHLINSDTSSLKEMPPQLGRMTNLQTLPNFVIGKGSGSGVREIESLLHLQGTLHLSRLENVICVEDANCANLKSKGRLEALLLEWSDSSVSAEIAAPVLGMLEPHSKLKELTIRSYAGLKFSTWIGNPSFSSMVSVRLEDCDCQCLPPFGQLPSLKELYIRRMDAVESVGLEFYGEGNLPFQALETLEFENLQNWKKWSPYQQNDGVGVFTCLKMLSIHGCPELEGSLPENLYSLARLDIYGCQKLVVSMPNYKELHESDIKICMLFLHDTSTVQFDLPRSFCSSNISELGFQTEAFKKNLETVRELKITGCEELTSLFENDDRLMQHLNSLHRLHINVNSALVEKLGKEVEELVQLQILDCKIECLELTRCGTLLKVPEGLHHLTSLQELHIVRCSSLVSFPDVGLPPCLQELLIDGCSSLDSFPDVGLPPCLQKLYINGCSNLVSFPDVGLPPCLQVIEIKNCSSLLHFAKYQIPPSLRTLKIRLCEKLKSLIEKEEVVVDGSCSVYCLEYLSIYTCPSLLSLLRKGQLPRTLRELEVIDCRQLELLTERILDETCQLEDIHISGCPNLKFSPDKLCHLTDLQSLSILRCQSLVSLPRMSVWPRQMSIRSCEKLEVADLLSDMMETEKLTIDYCEGLTTTSFPLNLTSIEIWKVKNCKALMEGLHRLASLRELVLWGDDPGLVSFPPGENLKEKEMLLPRSLVRLRIANFPNLKKLSKVFQFLTSLESLGIFNCSKLTTIPEEVLSLSLTSLFISRCSPLLVKRCRRKIAHIPYVDIGDN